MIPLYAAKARILKAAPTITAGAYSANDAVGGKLTFNVTDDTGGWGYILGWQVVDKGNVGAALRLTLFNQDFTAVADNAAWTVSDTESEYIFSVLETGTYKANGSANTLYTTTLSGPVLFRCAGGTKVYGQLMTTGTPTYTSTSDLVVKLHILSMR